MGAKEAQAYINSLPKYIPPPYEDIKAVRHLKVDYDSASEMPSYVQDKIQLCIEFIVQEFDPPYIGMVMSYVDGYPIDEKTSMEDFNLLKKVKKAKLSDFDFIVPTLPKMQIIQQISPLIKVDMFKYHHNDVKMIRVYEKELHKL